MTFCDHFFHLSHALDCRMLSSSINKTGGLYLSYHQVQLIKYILKQSDKVYHMGTISKLRVGKAYITFAFSISQICTLIAQNDNKLPLVCVHEANFCSGCWDCNVKIK